MDFKTSDELKLISKNNNLEDVYKETQETISAIIDQAEAAAKQGKYSVQIRKYGFSDGRLYANEPDAKQQFIIDQLNELGYEATIKAVEYQLVDIFLEVSWNEIK